MRFLLMMLSLVLTNAPAMALSLNAPPCSVSGGDGLLTLYSYPHDEIVDVRYLAEDGSVDQQEWRRINQLMRSPDGAVAPIDIRLIKLVDQMQDHFGVQTVEIISGYRSPKYNAKLKQEGRRVARESWHLQGRAADIHFDEISEGAMRTYATGLTCGGVGFYPALHFIHVDFGPVRTWGEAPAGKRKLVGEQPIAFTTEKNVYFTKQSVHWSPGGALVLEHFRRGAWKLQAQFPAKVTTLTLTKANFPFGKYRLRTHNKPYRFSNEFYFKQL